MEPKRGSVCVVAQLTNRVSLHFEPIYIIRERSNRSTTGFRFIIPFFFSFFLFFFFPLVSIRYKNVGPGEKHR